MHLCIRFVASYRCQWKYCCFLSTIRCILICWNLEQTMPECLSILYATDWFLLTVQNGLHGKNKMQIEHGRASNKKLWCYVSGCGVNEQQKTRDNIAIRMSSTTRTCAWMNCILRQIFLFYSLFCCRFLFECVWAMSCFACADLDIRTY